jgi:ferredoxin
MSVDVFYFSGTGNSLAVARDLSQRMDGRLVPIPSHMDEESIVTKADVVGVVFPVYGIYRIPSIVERFVRKLHTADPKYIFAVCTYGSMAGGALNTFRNVVELSGGRLSAGFAVNMPNNNITIPSFMYSGDVSKKEEKMFAGWQKKLDFICGYVRARKEGRFETTNRLLLSLFYPVDMAIGRQSIKRKYRKLTNSNLTTDELWPMMDMSFHSDGRCDGCGICAKLCPVGNIEMVKGKPAWQHRCERCMACLQWCPKEAIQFEKASMGRKRYHHPGVKISDMFRT